ncbi:surface lipoprotein assembly modifier [Novilysobacter antarcticus]|uniref:surface lipoprotein assembly modifier n=1 Tax=Novilysobacter antarcticus TaxID=2862543 RepID=UPI001C98FF0C|nr:outer membrane beta-barrel protein [Lysobacter antarcticus]
MTCPDDSLLADRTGPGNRVRSKACIPAITTALLAAMSGNTDAARVDYAIDTGVEHDDNVRVEAVNPASELTWRTGLGFLATESNSTIQASVNGRVDYRAFTDNAYDNTLEGVLDGRLNWVVLPDRLSFTLDERLQLEAIDRFAADSPDNRQQINVVSLGPNLFFNVGQTMRGQIEARYIDTHAEVTPQFNSQRLGVALRAIKDLGPSSALSINAQTQDVNFDDDLLSLDYKRNDLYARYERTFPNFDFGVDVGYSHLNYRDADDRSNPLVRAQLAWRPSHRSRLTLFAANQFADAAYTAISDVGTTSIPERVLIDGRTITAAIYEEKRVALGYDYRGERATFAVAPYAQKIDYPDPLNDDEDNRGVTIGFDYRLRPTLMLTSYLNFERVQYQQSDRTDDTRHLSLGLDKQWSRHWSTGLSYYRYERTSDLATAEAKQNVWYLSITYRNR